MSIHSKSRRTASSRAATPTADHRTRPRKSHPPRTFTALPDDHLLTTAELLERIPLDRQTIRRMVEEGRFPKPIQITRSRIAWRWSAVLAWVADREADPIAARSRDDLGRLAKDDDPLVTAG